MKKIVIGFILLNALNALANVPIHLVGLENQAKQQVISEAIKTLDLTAGWNVTYTNFNSNTGKFSEIWADMSFDFEVWQSSTKGYRCVQEQTRVDEQGIQSLQLKCLQIFPKQR